MVDYLTDKKGEIGKLTSQTVNIWGTSRLCMYAVNGQNAKAVAKKAGATVLLYGELRTDLMVDKFWRRCFT